jgi:hypothetical protein
VLLLSLFLQIAGFYIEFWQWEIVGSVFSGGDTPGQKLA